MEGKKCLLTCIGLLTIWMLWANDTEQYNAYISGNMKTWKGLMDKHETNQTITNEKTLADINYLYGYIAYCIGKNQKSEAAIYIKKMEQKIGQLEKANYRLSDVMAYKAAMMGFKIGVNVIKAPVYGPRSSDYAERALQLDANNPLAYLQVAHTKYYTPTIFGGSRTEAIRSYLKAIQLMESNPAYTKSNWLYLNAIVVLSYAYREEKKYDVCLFYLRKALKEEPRFSWVKNELIPECIKLSKN